MQLVLSTIAKCCCKNKECQSLQTEANNQFGELQMFRRHTNSINSLFFSTQLHKQKGKCLKLLPSPSPPPQKKRFVLVDRGQRKHLGWMHQLILVPHLSQVPRMVSMHYRALWIYKFLEITKQTLASVKLRVFYVAVAPTMLISSWVPMAEDAFPIWSLFQPLSLLLLSLHAPLIRNIYMTK
jgi:hypothetical protein